MAQLFSRYASGLQFTAGAMVGSVVGISGINPLIDRVNSISDGNQAVTGSLVSGTSTSLYGNFAGISAGAGIDFNNGSVIVGETATTGNAGIVELATDAEAAANVGGLAVTPTSLYGNTLNMNLSGTNVVIYSSGGNVGGTGKEYEWFDDSPNFNGNVYVSDDIYLNQNLSGCKVKGSYFASGLGSMTWELYKVSGTGIAVNVTSLGSYVGTSAGLVIGMTYDTNTGNYIESDPNTDFIYIHNGKSSSYIGSFAAPATNCSGLAYDSDTGNLYSGDLSNDHIYVHDGISSSLLGSWNGGANGPVSMAYDRDKKHLLSIDISEWMTIWSGTTIETSRTNLGSIDLGTLPGFIDSDATYIGYDFNNQNLLVGNAYQYPGYQVGIFVCSGISTTTLGSFQVGQVSGTTSDAIAYTGAGSLVYASSRQNLFYDFDLGMETESLVSGLSYNTDETFNPAVAQATYPKIRLKVNRSIAQNKLHKVHLDYE